jgi:hypothetical protein
MFSLAGDVTLALLCWLLIAAGHYRLVRYTPPTDNAPGSLVSSSSILLPLTKVRLSRHLPCPVLVVLACHSQQSLYYVTFDADH